MLAAADKIRVLIVDDSAVMRKMITGMLEQDEAIEIVGTAIDGAFALTKIEQLRPDVVTLDVEMPRMDGITALREIVAKHGMPVLMLSSHTSRGAALTMKALEAGAVDFICKPRGSGQISKLADELTFKVKEAARAARSVQVAPRARVAHKRVEVSLAPHRTGAAANQIVAIGASSGGPNALRKMLPEIPADFGAGIVIVQHMPESFTAVMARWLNEICQVEVGEARDGDLIAPGRALIAPGDHHMKVKKTRRGGVVVLEKSDPVNGHRPSVDVLFNSVAKEYGTAARAVLLTGMGSDGAEGMGEILRAGGRTLAQDWATSAIYGMPRSAVDRGYADTVAPLGEIAAWLISRVTKSQVAGGIREWKG